MKTAIPLVFLIFFSFIGCQNEKHDTLIQIDQLSHQLDSIQNIFDNIEWHQWESLSKKINDDITQIAPLAEEASKIDPDYLQYYGPYSTAGKILSRVFRKGKNQLAEELQFSALQLENLRKDVKSGVISEVDSIQYYINQETLAIEELVFNISSLKTTLQQQKEAHEATQEKVIYLINNLKKIRPSAFNDSAAIQFNENEEHQ